MLMILPYKKGSKSAKQLSKTLKAKLLKSQWPTYKRFVKPVINWGNTKRVITSQTMFLNHPMTVKNAVNKLATFRILKTANVSIPEFTTSYETACEWINEGHYVVARSLLESHSGKGITLAKTMAELPRTSKIYVKYFKKTYEYRVHVFNGKVIDYVQKKKRNSLAEEAYNKYIRSYNNGWVFCRDNVTLSETVRNLAVNAVKTLGLDFGAVDIVTKANGNAVVLEINTAPALTGTTLKKYTKAFKTLGL